MSSARVQRLYGSIFAEYPLSFQGVTVGDTESDAKTADDPKTVPVRARFSLVESQPIVEDPGGSGRIFGRLVAPYTLQDSDVILMGTRLFKFTRNTEAAAAATRVTKTALNVSDLFQEPAAELCAINPDGSTRINPDGSARPEKYPLCQQQVTLGRTDAKYTFRDDRCMSHCHARVYQRGEDFFLQDLGTVNGTFVRVRGKAAVPFGAFVLVGNQTFRIVQ